MISSKALDVEVLPNLFSFVLVDLNSYLNVFKDCVDSKGKAIPLTEKYTVAEIKDKLAQVKTEKYSITDYDDSQLLTMVGVLNEMQSKYITQTDNIGNIHQIPFRTDIYGYNLIGYDNLMIAAFLMYFNRFDKTKELITFLYNLSKEIIKHQNDELYGENKQLELIRQYHLPYYTVDLFTLFHLNSCGVNVDSQTGERKKFGKGLKQVSINLKWHELLQFNLPPISDKDIHYYHKLDHYRGLSAEQLNHLIEEFDRYIIEEYRTPLLDYNVNDVFIVCEMARQNPDEIRLRYSITNLYKINALSSARSNIADKLVTRYYSKMSGLHPSKFKKLRTEHTWLHFSKIIFPHIQFKTKQLQDILNEMKKVKITRTNKDAFSLHKELPNNRVDIEIMKNRITQAKEETKNINNYLIEIERQTREIQDEIKKINVKISYAMKEKDKTQNEINSIKKKNNILRNKIVQAENSANEFLYEVAQLAKATQNIKITTK